MTAQKKPAGADPAKIRVFLGIPYKKSYQRYEAGLLIADRQVARASRCTASRVTPSK